jgi:hypothetical protein
MMLRLALVLALAGVAPAMAQHHHGAAAPSALTEQEIEDLKSGTGMDLAVAAERNGYPGPKHVLELAEKLGLATEQRAVAERLAREVRAKAIPLGHAVIAAEADLDQLFKSGTATAADVAAATERAGRLRAELRGVHLVAHLQMREALSEQQRATYVMLRGIGTGHGDH